MTLAREPAPARRPRDRAARIAVSARDLFAERGFHSVRMSDVAAANGISARALYRHFPSKQALLSHVLIETQSEFLAAAEVSTSQADRSNPKQALLTLAHGALRARYMGRLWRSEARHVDPDDVARLRRRLDPLVTYLAELAAGCRPGLGPIEAQVRAWAVIALVNSYDDQPTSLSDDQISEELAAMAFAVIDDNADLASGDIQPALGQPPADPPRPPRTRREQLLQAAARAFRRQGFDGTGVDGLAAATGLAGPTVYRHFPSKAAMLTTIVIRFQEWVALEQARAVRLTEHDQDVLAELVSGYTRIAAEAADLLSVTITEARHLDTENQERLTRFRAEQLQEWTYWAQRARPGMRDDARSLAITAARTLIEDTVRLPLAARTPEAVATIGQAANAVLYRAERAGERVIPTSQPGQVINQASTP